MNKLYERLLARPVFRLREAESLMPEWNPRAARQRLKDLVSRGRVGRIGFGVYFVVLPGRTPDTTTVDPYLVASRLAPDAVLGYHTALEVLGTAYSAAATTYFVSVRYRRPMTWRGMTYRQIRPPKPLIQRSELRFGVATQERDGLPVVHTGRERTLADCLDRLDLAGGLDELSRSVEAWPKIVPEVLVEYLALLGKATLYSKVGFVLEQFAAQWGLADSDLTTFEEKLPRSPVYLADRKRPSRYVRRWNLMVPHSMGQLAKPV